MEKIRVRAAKYKYTYLNWGFAVKIVILAILWWWLVECFLVVKDLEPLKTFVPHELLGVEQDATKAQVKKAYRRLSREKHPDKNPDNPQAVNEFI